MVSLLHKAMYACIISCQIAYILLLISTSLAPYVHHTRNYSKARPGEQLTQHSSRETLPTKHYIGSNKTETVIYV